ncbi:MAG: hypothetical protein KAW41_06050 [Candidatus Diapherotrites archaeon]|nr:hypothetical protein [Candidatus Diapherotrites archaeon]
MALKYEKAKEHYNNALKLEREIWTGGKKWPPSEQRRQQSLSNKIEGEIAQSLNALQKHIKKQLELRDIAADPDVVAEVIAKKVLADAKVKGFDNAYFEHYNYYTLKKAGLE